MRHSPDQGNAAQTRRRIAVEAARMIAEQGLRDFHMAKLKAAAQLGLGASTALPRNSEIEDALREHQRLFQSDSQPRQLAKLRETAVEAMEFLSLFEPRLVGPVLDGTADVYSAICLHLFTDNADDVAVFLGEQRIPFEQQQRDLRMSTELTCSLPVFVFAAGDASMDLTVFPVDGLRQAPLDRVSGQTMRRASRDAVMTLAAGRT
ncbi:MAG TPA: hypothetical protein VFN25_14750 [Dokdonella sp.]|uniref:hypothetical protein n=1 Tax=Dokdonella sp. TaxID=2291710 RepID=UPI002D800C6B|nr:hypothetical protein [Dokdonella sp.]HET9034150.1 hypothetical protein [Dokdonella sp.]